MSFLWRYLDKIYPGSGSMFLLHLTLLYLSNVIFIYIFRDSKIKWWYAVYALLPNIVAYTILIVKDAGFTYSYLLTAAILALLIINKIEKNKLPTLLLVTLLLFYGTAVKFQAQFILVFFTYAIAYCLHHYKSSIYTIISSILIYLSIMFAINTVSSILVPATQKDHSWQMVKLFDLSAISMMLQQPIYPDFIIKQNNFDFLQVKKLFEDSKVDNLVFGPNPVLNIGKAEEERTQLWNFWFATIKQYPMLYLKARLKLFSYNLTTSPCDYNKPSKFLQTTKLGQMLDRLGLTSTLDNIHSFFKSALKFMWMLPVLIFYFCFSIININKARPEALLLLIFTSASLTLLTILLFFSMAGTARYVFYCICFLQISHGFAYKILRGHIQIKELFIKNEQILVKA